MIVIKEIKVKTILSKTKKQSAWFNIMYNANFYRGCPHKCIYCDSRSECYNVANFDDIEVKINTLEILEKELSSKRIKGIIGTGAMSDPYLPIESKYKITSNALKLIDKYNYPVVIITKSDLVIEDLATLLNINNNTKATVIFTLTTVNDSLAKIVEPYATSPSNRLKAMKILSSMGIYTGVLMMPVLPFIEDNVDNIKEVVELSHLNGAKFIIPGFGVTLRDRQRDYYYDKLDQYFPGIKEKYTKTYGNSYNCNSRNYKTLYKEFKELCNKYNIITDMKEVEHYNFNPNLEQIKFYLDNS